MAYANVQLAPRRGLPIPPAVRALSKRYLPSGSAGTCFVLDHAGVVHGPAGTWVGYTVVAIVFAQIVWGCGQQAVASLKEAINRDREHGGVHVHLHEQVTMVGCPCGGGQRAHDGGPGNAAGTRYI